MQQINIDDFAQEIRAIGREAQQSLSIKDYYHMRAVGLFGQLLFVLAVVSCVFGYAVIAALLLSQSLMTKWLLMHHIGHGGYNKVPGVPKRFHSKYYAIGWRRYIHWFDWIRADAWNHEHNYLHHSFTGEDKDPDLVERNLQWLSGKSWPMPVKVLILLFFSATWKFTYYSGRTLSYLRGYNMVNFKNFFDVRQKAQRHMWFELFVPYILFNFVLLPVILNYFVPGAGQTFLIARILTELIHNMHMFLVIIPNHAGDDLYRFDDVPKEQRRGSSFYLRQVLGSANYHTGKEWIDLSHMYLNYQIEHHLFSALPMRQYRLIQPKVKAVCEKYGVEYIQQSVWARCLKMTDIAIGKTKMRNFDDYVSPPTVD